LAKSVVRGIERNQPLVLAPAIVRTTPFFRGVLPLKLFDWVGKIFGVNTTMYTWRGHTPETPASTPHKPAQSADRDKAGIV
jgi:hypothetical protein